MKNLKTLFALMFIVGLLGISQAFACKFPGENLVNANQTKSVSKTEVQESADLSDDANFYGKRSLSGRYSSFSQATFYDPTSNRTLYATCVGVVTFGDQYFLAKIITLTSSIDFFKPKSESQLARQQKAQSETIAMRNQK